MLNISKTELAEKANALNFARDTIKKVLRLVDILSKRVFRKKYRPELLFGDADILRRIDQHPMVKWKLLEH